jgi:SHS2 domain-containing protein
MDAMESNAKMLKEVHTDIADTERMHTLNTIVTLDDLEAVLVKRNN